MGLIAIVWTLYKWLAFVVGWLGTPLVLAIAGVALADFLLHRQFDAPDKSKHAFVITGADSGACVCATFSSECLFSSRAGENGEMLAIGRLAHTLLHRQASVSRSPRRLINAVFACLRECFFRRAPTH